MKKMAFWIIQHAGTRNLYQMQLKKSVEKAN